MIFERIRADSQSYKAAMHTPPPNLLQRKKKKKKKKKHWDSTFVQILAG